MVFRRAGSITCHWKGWALEIETFLGLKMATSEASSIPFKSSKIADKSDPSMMRSIEEPLSRDQYARPHPSGCGLQVSGKRRQEIQTVSFLLSSSWKVKIFCGNTHSLTSLSNTNFRGKVISYVQLWILYLKQASYKLTVSFEAGFLIYF